jgi:ArsR family transcriptional regulator
MPKHNRELYRLKAQLCKTFADPNRLMIIEELRSGEKSVGEIAEAIELPQAVASRHLAILRNRGVVKFRRKGAHVYYSLTDAKIFKACELVHEILLNQIDKNHALVESL